MGKVSQELGKMFEETIDRIRPPWPVFFKVPVDRVPIGGRNAGAPTRGSNWLDYVGIVGASGVFFTFDAKYIGGDHLVRKDILRKGQAEALEAAWTSGGFAFVLVGTERGEKLVCPWSFLRDGSVEVDYLRDHGFLAVRGAWWVVVEAVLS